MEFNGRSTSAKLADPIDKPDATPFERRTARSVAHAKNMARALNVDLFDEDYRGRFSEIVQNCSICAHHSDCGARVAIVSVTDTPPLHCRNKGVFRRIG
mmetsp:Transcript_4713/g.8357  ORF Transcript_4713/g.8357 Transcript_4713/m.8357 type:complete len:99 (+) Transcript_4713:309-605(+)